MPKKQGDRLNVGEVKSSIIGFILENVRSVGEPAIRDFLSQKYDLMDQGNINRHLHDLQKLDCIELIPPQKKGMRNYWDITKLKNLKNIRREFPELRLNMHEKSINIILQEIGRGKYNPDWLKLYIQLLISTSFFNACIELGIMKLYHGIYKIYTTSNGSYRHHRINDLLKICYFTCIKYHSDFKMPEKAFTDAMKALPWEHITFFDKEHVLKWIKDHLPRLPDEISLQIFKTKFPEIEKIPEKIPDEINDKDLVSYMLNTISLIIEQKWDYKFAKDDLLLKHFFDQDMLFGVNSDDEHYFVKKTIENHTLPSGSTEPHNLILQEAELADLELASEMIYAYKQPAQFSDGCNNPDEVKQKVLEFNSYFQLRQ
jgi:hypothetical protein